MDGVLRLGTHIYLFWEIERGGSSDPHYYHTGKTDPIQIPGGELGREGIFNPRQDARLGQSP